MKETLDVWVIVPRDKPHPRAALHWLFFESPRLATRYRLDAGGGDYRATHVVCKATLTMETEGA
ncbi:MAG: hypothetical protein KAV00_01915 [Phycisphaerae bacterium]|nr:hypothetical protein [Phycisphaerae bacterium]